MIKRDEQSWHGRIAVWDESFHWGHSVMKHMENFIYNKHRCRAREIWISANDHGDITVCDWWASDSDGSALDTCIQNNAYSSVRLNNARLIYINIALIIIYTWIMFIVILSCVYKGQTTTGHLSQQNKTYLFRIVF